MHLHPDAVYISTSSSTYIQVFVANECHRAVCTMEHRTPKFQTIIQLYVNLKTFTVDVHLSVSCYYCYWHCCRCGDVVSSNYRAATQIFMYVRVRIIYFNLEFWETFVWYGMCCVLCTRSSSKSFSVALVSRDDWKMTRFFGMKSIL